MRPAFRVAFLSLWSLAPSAVASAAGLGAPESVDLLVGDTCLGEEDEYGMSFRQLRGELRVAEGSPRQQGLGTQERSEVQQGFEMQRAAVMKAVKQQDSSDTNMAVWDDVHQNLHFAYALDPSYCLSTDGNSIGNGVKVHLWKCDSTWYSRGQNFRVGGDGRVRMQQNPNYCVVIDGDRFQNGGEIQLWSCDERNHNQVWSMDLPGQVVSAEPSMCLVVDGNRATNGAEIQLWRCARAEPGNRADYPQFWMQVHKGSGRRAYTRATSDRPCDVPTLPVASSSAACVAAADALQPGKGCYDHSWAETIQEVHEPLWPKGCFFHSACQGGCGLRFNPGGHTMANRSYPGAGDCQSISVICEVPAV